MIKAKHITRIAYKQQPEKGERGERGAIRRITEWAGDSQYYSGADGEPYEDVVIYDGVYYQCLKSHVSNGHATPYMIVNGGGNLWEVTTQFKFVCTKGLFIGSNNQGWIADAGRLYHTSGKIELSEDGSIMTSNGKFKVDQNGNMVAKSGTFGNLTIGLTNTGNPRLSGDVIYDEHETHSIEISPEVFKLSAFVDGEEVEAVDFMPYFYADAYDRNESFRLKIRPGHFMSIEGGMIAGVRPLIRMSSSTRITLGDPGRLAHPGVYVLTSSQDTIFETLQTGDYTIGDCFTIINKSADTVAVINRTQSSIFNALDGKSYKQDDAVVIDATIARMFYMLWTEDGFILYK